MSRSTVAWPSPASSATHPAIRSTTSPVGIGGSFVRSGSDGTYRIGNLTPGDTPGLRVQGRLRQRHRSIRVVAGPGEKALDVTLLRWAVLTGSVVFDDGAPLVFGQVRLWRPGSPNPEISVTTDSNGHFSTRVGPGAWQVEFLDNWSGFGSRFYENAADRASATILQLAEDESRDIAATFDRLGSISGRITDINGSPVSATVEVFDSDGSRVVSTTGYNGSYVVRGLLPGAYTLKFSTSYGRVPNRVLRRPIEFGRCDARGRGNRRRHRNRRDPHPAIRRARQHLPAG